MRVLSRVLFTLVLVGGVGLLVIVAAGVLLAAVLEVERRPAR